MPQPRRLCALLVKTKVGLLHLQRQRVFALGLRLEVRRLGPRRKHTTHGRRQVGAHIVRIRAGALAPLEALHDLVRRRLVPAVPWVLETDALRAAELLRRHQVVRRRLGMHLHMGHHT